MKPIFLTPFGCSSAVPPDQELDAPSLHGEGLSATPKVDKVGRQNTENESLKKGSVGQGLGKGVVDSAGHQGVCHHGEDQARDKHHAKDQDAFVGKTSHSPEDRGSFLWIHVGHCPPWD